MSRRVWKLAYSATLAVLIVLVVGSFVRRGINFSPHAMFADMVDGTAHRPFVQRSLVPFLIQQISSLVPEGLRQFIDESIRNPLLQVKLIQQMRLLDADWTRLMVAMAIWYTSVLGFALSLKRLARCFYRVDERFLDVLSLVAVAGLPVFFRYYSYLYDLTHLFLFTACLIPLALGRFALYLPLLLLATFSKETSVLLIAIFALQYFRSLPRPRFVLFLAVQCLIFGGVRLFLGVSYAENPGGAVEAHLLDHNLWLWPYELPQFLALCVLGIAIARGWRSKPAFLRVSFATILPVLVGLTLLLGFVDEYRDYYEVYAVMLLLMVPVIAEMLGLASVEVFDESERAGA